MSVRASTPAERPKAYVPSWAGPCLANPDVYDTVGLVNVQAPSALAPVFQYLGCLEGNHALALRCLLQNR
jgi:hypothetical protein